MDRKFWKWLETAGGGMTDERPKTDHVISGSMRGVKKLHPMAQTSRHPGIQIYRHPDIHGDSMTESAQSGPRPIKLSSRIVRIYVACMCVFVYGVPSLRTKNKNMSKM